VSNQEALQASDRYHAWEARHLIDLKQYVSHLIDLDKRRPVTSVIETFEKTLIDRKEVKKFRRGSVMAISMMATIVGDVMTVSGAIDFGDTLTARDDSGSRCKSR